MSPSRSLAWSLALLLLVGTASFDIAAQSTTGAVSAPQGRSWASLTSAQQSALAPLQGEWSSIDSIRKTKWIEIANRLPQLSPEERARIQTRMSEWAKLSANERVQARRNFKEAQTVPAEDRKAKWEAYKALTPEEQRKLAARNTAAASAPVRGGPARRAAGENKSNLVPNPAYAARPKAASPSTTPQAQPGATTNLVSKRPTPPAHQQPGLPKVTAGANFVDENTLLPKRGAQAAGTRSAASAPVIARP